MGDKSPGAWTGSEGSGRYGGSETDVGWNQAEENRDFGILLVTLATWTATTPLTSDKLIFQNPITRSCQ